MVTRSLNTRTLHAHSVPMRLYEAAKGAGGWNPSSLDFTEDRHDWQSLDGPSRLPILALTVLATDCLHAQMRNCTILQLGIEEYGNFEESLCFSSLAFETARFAELYNRILQDTIPLVGDPERFRHSRFQSTFTEHMPQILERLRTSSSPKDLIKALTYFGPIGKGILGATGIHVLCSFLDDLDIMPTLRAALDEEKRSIRRHAEFATYFIGRLLEERPALWETVEETMTSAFEPAIGDVREFYDRYNPSMLARAEAVTFAVEQFSRGYEQLEMVRARQPSRAHAPVLRTSLA